MQWCTLILNSIMCFEYSVSSKPQKWIERVSIHQIWNRFVMLFVCNISALFGKVIRIFIYVYTYKICERNIHTYHHIDYVVLQYLFNEINLTKFSFGLFTLNNGNDTGCITHLLFFLFGTQSINHLNSNILYRIMDKWWQFLFV